MTHPTNSQGHGSNPPISVTEQLFQYLKDLQALTTKLALLWNQQNERDHHEALTDEAVNLQQQDINIRINNLEKKLNDFQKTAITNIWLAFIAGLIVGFVSCSLYNRNWQILPASSC